jgi:hypothetical protein
MKTYGYFNKILNDYVKQEIKEIMKKEIFRVGDRVFHIQYGWGEIIEEINCYDNLKIAFDKKVESWDWFDKSYISFTEYTLQGFSQERPIVLPEVGELCLFRRCDTDKWFVGNFKKYKKNLYYSESHYWEQCKRIKILD